MHTNWRSRVLDLVLVFQTKFFPVDKGVECPLNKFFQKRPFQLGKTEGGVGGSESAISENTEKSVTTSSAQLGSAQRSSVQFSSVYSQISFARKGQLREAQLSNSILSQISFAQKNLKFGHVPESG